MSGTTAGALPGDGRHRRDAAGTRQEENPFTVFLIDPLALPLVSLLARARRVGPNHVTLAGMVLGLGAGPLYLFDGAWPGALAFYLALVADCVDGKLAHRTGRTSPRGQRLESLADRLRVLSAWIGLIALALRDGQAWLLAAMAGYVVVPAFRAAYRRLRPGAADPGRWLAARLPVPQPMRRRRVGVWFGSWDRTAICFAVAPLLGAWAGPVALAAVAADALWVAAGWLLMVGTGGGRSPCDGSVPGKEERLG